MSSVSPSAVASILPGINTTIISQSLCSPVRVWLPLSLPHYALGPQPRQIPLILLHLVPQSYVRAMPIVYLCSALSVLVCAGARGAQLPTPRSDNTSYGSTSYSWNVNSLWTLKRECTEEIRRLIFFECAAFSDSAEKFTWNVHALSVHHFQDVQSGLALLCLGYFIHHYTWKPNLMDTTERLMQKKKKKRCCLCF